MDVDLEQVVLPVAETKRQIDNSEVLSALGELLSNQLACERCAATTNLNEPQSPCPLPPTDQQLNQNTATRDNTTAAQQQTNNVDLDTVSCAGELMRHILHDIKKLKTAITQHRTAHSDRSHRRLDVEELHQRNKERRNQSRTSLSDDDDSECQLSKGRQLRHDMRSPRFPTTTRDCRLSSGAKFDDRNVNTDRTRLEHLRNNLEPPPARRSSRWIEAVDDDVDERNRDDSLPTSLPPRRKIYPSYPAPPQFMTSAGSAYPHVYGSVGPRQLQSSYQPSQHLPQQQQHPHQVTRQFYQQQMQTCPRQIPQQPQSSAFRPIQQMAPVQHQPLVFVPVSQHGQVYHNKQQQQQNGRFRPISVHHSPDVSPRANKQQVRSQQMTDAVKLANETKNLTAQIQKRQEQRPRQHCYRL